jgi:hypothetical protein
MLAQFQIRYPNASLISELVTIDRGKYLVKASIQIEGVIRATGMAAADTVEQAEDQARIRALAVLLIDSNKPEQPPKQEALKQPAPRLIEEPTFSHGQLDSVPLNRVSTDTSWLDDTSDTDVSTQITSSPMTSMHIAAPEIAANWNKNVLKEEPAKAAVADVYTEDEPSFSGNKVTSISSRRVDPDKSATGLEPTNTQTSAASKKAASVSDPIDRSNEIALINIEMKRLGWTDAQGRDYLIQTYNKRSRSNLSDPELLEFLQYLESQPDPQEK